MKRIIFVCTLILLIFSYAFGVPTPSTGGHLFYPDAALHPQYAYQGSYGIWYRTNEGQVNKLKKPLLLVSGFDPSDIMRIGKGEVITDTYTNDDKKDKNRDDKTLVYLYNVANKNDFLDKLRARGYDVIAYRCV